jgi:hypothetical protein
VSLLIDLVLAAAPNLEKLIVAGDQYDSKRLAAGSLPSLELLVLSDRQQSGYGRLLFPAAPRLQRFHGQSLAAGFILRGATLEHMTELSFSYCMLPLELLEDAVAMCPSLQTFSYTAYLHADTDHFTPRDLSRILEPAKNSLQHLQISFEHVFGYGELTENQLMLSLGAFTNLISLAVNGVCVFIPSMADNSDSRSSILSRFLPRNIVSLRLDLPHHGMTNEFIVFARDIKNDFPLLKQVVLGSARYNMRDAVSGPFKEAGVNCLFMAT